MFNPDNPMRPPLPYSNGALCRLLNEKIDGEYQSNGRTKREIALAIGYDKPNVLSMYTRGEAVMPVDRALVAADVLGIDIVELIEAGAITYRSNPAWQAARTIMHRLRPPEPLAVA